MPVDQTGETILFVLEDGYVEAHIQIQIDPETEADQFAWVIPVMALPEFAVGSQPMFDSMLNQTAPSYGSSSWREQCDFDDDWSDPTCSDGNADPGGDEDGGLAMLDAGSGDSGPDVVSQQSIGAFEIAVLEGGTAESVAEWLTDNGYQMDPDATPILEEYLAQGFLFAAVKLATSAETSDVHPIVLRIPGDEPCVPIKLTRIAAVDDLRLRVMFLSHSRVVPDNYRHVVLNDLKLDWVNRGTNYDAIVTQAVDATGGQGWVTEYAGMSEIVQGTESLVGGDWDADAFLEVDPMTALELMENQFLDLHPLAAGLFREFVIPPEGIEIPEAFWMCPECDPDLLTACTFDGPGFADAMRTRIVDPAAHAHEVFSRFGYLTRMYTTMSPHEMTLDPTFVENREAQDQSQLEHLGLAASFCNGDASFRLPDDRLVAVPDTTVWPAFDDLSAFERVEQWGPAGAPLVLTDQRAIIDAALEAWNQENGGVRAPPMSGSPCDDDDWGHDTAGFDGAFSDEDRAGGCGCRSGSAPAALFALIGLGLLGLRRRV